MNDQIQAALAPLGAFWIALEAMMKIASFVNAMRDTIMIGELNKTPLTLQHRQAIFVDWQLTMVGFILADAVFSFVLYSLADVVSQAKIAMYGVAFTTFIGAIIFTACGIFDYKAIKRTLGQTNSAAT